MKTFVFANLKGGVGKTTATLLFASAIKHAGFSVRIDDRDPQRSASALAPNMGLDLGQSGDVVVVDTPPSLALPATTAAIRDADVCVVLTSPSPVDVTTTAAALKTVLQLRRPDRTRVLFNSVQTGTRLAAMMEKFGATLEVPVLRNRIGRRQAYQLCQLGGSWSDLPGCARDEIQCVAMELMAL